MKPYKRPLIILGVFLYLAAVYGALMPYALSFLPCRMIKWGDIISPLCSYPARPHT